MTQNIYDDPAFFTGYSGLPRSTRGLDGAPEWPALRALLPPLAGLRVVDLGCGFGWFCRFARAQGAAQVLGLDVSENMLAKARRAAAPAPAQPRDTADPPIEYRHADLERLTLPAAAFDLAYSSLALHYVADLAGLLATVHDALVPGGRLVFSIEHPIFMAARPAGWLTVDGRRIWPVDSYQAEGERRSRWFVDDVVKQHRTLGTTLNALIRAGFAIAHVEDWGPTDAQLADQPELAEERERPTFLLVAAHRT